METNQVGNTPQVIVEEKYVFYKDPSFWAVCVFAGGTFFVVLKSFSLSADWPLLVGPLINWIVWEAWIIFRKGKRWSFVVGFLIAMAITIIVTIFMVNYKSSIDRQKSQAEFNKNLQQVQEKFLEETQKQNSSTQQPAPSASVSNSVPPVAQPVRSTEDIAIMDQLDGLGAETYYRAAGNTYSGLCGSALASSMWVSKALANTKDYNGGIKPACNSSATAYAVSSPLSDRTKFYCVDSTGFKGEIATPLGAGTVCPH